MAMTRKASETTEVMKMMKATATTKMTLMNQKERNKRLEVSGTLVLIVIWKKKCHSI